MTRRRRLLPPATALVAMVVAGLCVAPLTGPGSAGSTTAGTSSTSSVAAPLTGAKKLPRTRCRVFPKDSIFHADVSRLPVHARSAAWMSSMGDPGQDLHPDFGPSFGEQPVPYGIPVTVVGGKHRKVPVRFDYASESDEVRKGRVDHPIRFTTDVTSRSFVWPARHQAGSTDSAAHPPMGAWFRMKGSFSLAGWSRDAKVILRGMKKHGMVIADNGSPWYFQGTADKRWPAPLVEELKGIPSSAFEAVDVSSLKVKDGSGRTR